MPTHSLCQRLNGARPSCEGTYYHGVHVVRLAVCRFKFHLRRQLFSAQGTRAARTLTARRPISARPARASRPTPNTPRRFAHPPVSPPPIESHPPDGVTCCCCAGRPAHSAPVVHSARPRTLFPERSAGRQWTRTFNPWATAPHSRPKSRFASWAAGFVGIYRPGASCAFDQALFSFVSFCCTGFLFFTSFLSIMLIS